MNSPTVIIELIGWTSSVILLATLIRQVYVQYRSGSVGGLSKWLFLGQMMASVGFAVYSLLLKNWVFTASNIAILAVAIVGELLYARNREHQVNLGKGKGAGEDSQETTQAAS